MNELRVNVIGLGYIGLPTSALIASNKINVLGTDINKDIVKKVNHGLIHIIEPNLDKLVKDAVESSYLKAALDSEASDIFIITVPTPFDKENLKPDMSYVFEAVNNIAPHLKKGNLIILESTSPVGTTEEIKNILQDKRPDLTFPYEGSVDSDVSIAYCPERVLPGNIINELINNDRIIGGLCKKSSNKAANFYKRFIKGNCFETNSKTAEMSKLVENSYRDVNIAFANELSSISQSLDINEWELINLANKHPRVNILNPGPGVGGHCIAIDPWFIVHKSPDKAEIIKKARKINEKRPYEVSKIILDNIFQNSFNSIGFFGISYKPDIDDLRESPSIEVIKEISKNSDCDLYVIEPNINHLPEDIENISELISYNHAILNCDLIVILVNHKEFLNLNFNDLKTKVLDFSGLTNKF